MDNNMYLIALDKKKKEEIEKIRNCNEYTNQYGLTLTEEQIHNIVEKRVDALRYTERLEFGDWIIDKIIKEFADSPYIQKDNYAEIIYELIDIFYSYKNETGDLVSDDELLSFMKEHFDGICQGSLDYLAGTVLDRMANNVLNGKPMEYLLNREEIEDDEDYE